MPHQQQTTESVKNTGGNHERDPTGCVGAAAPLLSPGPSPLYTGMSSPCLPMRPHGLLTACSLIGSFGGSSVLLALLLLLLLLVLIILPARVPSPRGLGLLFSLS